MPDQYTRPTYRTYNVKNIEFSFNTIAYVKKQLSNNISVNIAHKPIIFLLINKNVRRNVKQIIRTTKNTIFQNITKLKSQLAQ